MWMYLMIPSPLQAIVYVVSLQCIAQLTAQLNWAAYFHLSNHSYESMCMCVYIYNISIWMVEWHTNSNGHNRHVSSKSHCSLSLSLSALIRMNITEWWFDLCYKRQVGVINLSWVSVGVFSWVYNSHTHTPYTDQWSSFCPTPMSECTSRWLIINNINIGGCAIEHKRKKYKYIYIYMCICCILYIYIVHSADAVCPCACNLFPFICSFSTNVSTGAVELKCTLQ